MLSIIQKILHPIKTHQSKPTPEELRQRRQEKLEEMRKQGMWIGIG